MTPPGVCQDLYFRVTEEADQEYLFCLHAHFVKHPLLPDHVLVYVEEPDSEDTLFVDWAEDLSTLRAKLDKTLSFGGELVFCYRGGPYPCFEWYADN